MEAVRLETGFVYIKVVVVTAAESCGEKVKAQVRAFIYLWGAVGNAVAAVGKHVRRNFHNYYPPLSLHRNRALPTKKRLISTVVHRLSPSGGKEGENGHNPFKGVFLTWSAA